MKRKAAVPVLAILFALMLAVGIVANAAGTNGGTGGTADTASSSVSETEQILDEDVFPRDKVIDVKVTLDEDDFQDILDNASAEEYKTASVNYNGVQMDNIGIRAKGNLSLRSVVQMEDSDRYSFKLSFDEYVNQTLDGISKINLNNGYSDASYMREFLTYELADLMGLPTPKFSFVNLYVNGELRGLYLAVEQIGDAYLERNFGNSSGALYKGTMDGSGSDLQWIDDNPDSYSGLALKSDKTDNDILIDMLDELNNGSDYEKYINIDDALGYIALNVLTVNTDSYIGGNKQNYYLYDSDGVFSILPWDYNMAFGGLGGGGGSSSALMIDEPTQGTLAERPLVAKLLAVDEYKEKYHQMIQEVLDGYLSNDQFSARVQEVSDMISPYVEQDPTSFYTYDEYEQGVEKLISINASNVEAYQSQLDGESAISGDGSGSGGGMGGGGFGGGGSGDMQPPEGFENMFGGGGQGQGQQAPTDGQNGDSSAQGTDTTTAESQNQAAADNTAASAGTSVSAAKLTTASLSSASSRTILTAAASTGDDAANVPDQGNGGPQGGMGTAPGSQAQGDTQQGNAAGDQAQGDTQQGNAGGRGGFGGGGMGGMQPPDGFGGGGGGMPGMGGGQDTAQGDPKEAITTVVMLVLLAAASVFVIRFKRKRW